MTTMACDTARRVPWPSELGFTRLTMLLRIAYADTPCDEDGEPDAQAPQGTVMLTWNAPWFRYRPSDGGPVQGWGAHSVECQILPDGTIAPPESTATSNGSVIVMPTVHELLEPSGSTITASINLMTPGPKFQPISFQARPGATVNILAEADMGEQSGVIVKPVVTETTAERAEAAALRAEQAAAGVADIGEQVEQVQEYATRAETAATSAETAASSAEAASAEAATVTTDAAYIRDVIAQHGTLKGDPGPAPTVEWQGDRLSVNGELGPSLTGAPGQDGGPVPAGGSAGQVITRTEGGGVAWTDMAGGDGLNIVGPGRPDRPGTTGGLVDGTETVGTTYTSTDGAGVGAWVWRKRPNGWVVVDGEAVITGTYWAQWPSGGSDYVAQSTLVDLTLRRTPAGVSVACRLISLPGTDKLQVIYLPPGFRPVSAIPAKLFDSGYVQYLTEDRKIGGLTTGWVRAPDAPHVTNRVFFPGTVVPCTEPWPTTLTLPPLT